MQARTRTLTNNESAGIDLALLFSRTVRNRFCCVCIWLKKLKLTNALGILVWGLVYQIWCQTSSTESPVKGPAVGSLALVAVALKITQQLTSVTGTSNDKGSLDIGKWKQCTSHPNKFEYMYIICYCVLCVIVIDKFALKENVSLFQKLTNSPDLSTKTGKINVCYWFSEISPFLKKQFPIQSASIVI